MKGTATLLSLFLVFAFASYLPSATSFDLFDTDGELLLNGGSYYVVAVKRGSGGGIELTATGKETCPVTVVQSRNEVSKGKPVTLYSPILLLYINQNFPIRIGFTSAPTCAPTSTWTIVEGLPEGPAVKLGDYDDARSGSFKIKKVSEDSHDYKIVFCSGDDTCEEIGVYVDSKGNRRLVLTQNDPLVVQFQRARSSSE
uniref:Kunitz-type chymotrypsin inhibitor n=1 Tax=Rhynchosia sublobata TaxID=1703813 RepID=A0A0K2CTU9_9FABA|nr:Kunitz-type chymotrypsin inhibitor precursor [Rhynchosia sublobata]